MKNRMWVLMLSLLLIISLSLSLWLMWPANASYAEVWSEGKLLYTLDLRVDREVTVKTDAGINVITVRTGKIAVTQANCPDGYCMARGFCSGGVQIVCLPNQLVIKFLEETEIDGVVG